MFRGHPVVLVGCQKGVAVVDADTGNLITMLLEPYRGTMTASKEGSGYNAALLRRRQCWASKSDVGLLCWELDRPAAPYAVMQAGRSHAVRFIRAVVVDAGGIIWFGADNWLLNCASGLPTAPNLEWFVPVDSPVTSVEVDGEDIWLGTQVGGLWRISQFDPRSSELMTISPGQAVEAVTIRRTGMVRWLVYADGKSAVLRTVNGSYTRNLAGNGGIRAVRTAGRVAGWPERLARCDVAVELRFAAQGASQDHHPEAGERADPGFRRGLGALAAPTAGRIGSARSIVERRAFTGLHGYSDAEV